jgi:hypothetical protein
MTLRQWWVDIDYLEVCLLIAYCIVLIFCLSVTSLIYIDAFSSYQQMRKLDDLKIKERELDILERQVQIEKNK